MEDGEGITSFPQFGRTVYLESSAKKDILKWSYAVSNVKVGSVVSFGLQTLPRLASKSSFLSSGCLNSCLAFGCCQGFLVCSYSI